MAVLVTAIVVLVVLSSVLSVIAAEAYADSISASIYNTTAPVLDCENCLNDGNFTADFHEVAWSSKGGFVLIFTSLIHRAHELIDNLTFHSFILSLL
jgi:hypothetical protein